MEVVNCNRALLSNLEVYNFLKDIQTGREKYQRIGKNQTNLATVIYETIQHLEQSSCRSQTPEQITAFLQEVSKKFQLTKAERLMLVNHCPATPVEIQLLIDNADERLSEEQVNNLLELVAQHFPPAAAK